ncbi:MAG TPA: proteasome subunit alpha [Verrucomicrobiae bacterium]|nr:proteasome subunit alpha [Verrucomicrobiae bacterium]
MDHPVPIPQFPHDGDFLSVLKAHGYEVAPRLIEAAAQFQHDIDKGGIATEGTTVLAVKYKDGVLMAGDRRATAGNLVMYERAEKLINIDERSILAIAGVPAVAFEMARVLEHSFKYYQRSQLQEMSTAGKVRSLSKLLKENLPLTLQGVGMVVPVFATYEAADSKDNGGKVYFYDALGAQFEGVDYAASGSGSLAVRSVLHYLNNWGGKPLAKFSESEIVTTALRVLDTAADTDTATSGYNPKTNIFPIIRVITREGIREIPESELARVYKSEV